MSMKVKHLNKEVVAYKFKREMLSKPEYVSINDDQKEILWKIYLLMLLDIKKITPHQTKTWTYPKQYIK